ncbi:hypothetical protein DGMP_29850 [Desulfomarina profundi]|uniref:Secretin/TonB short N-terminal domain-containing protein n=1 Tax=Desulfomarina profundi TaxID=2772557 RepID=A0A8D5FIL0_9BACT|nr:hypothetical protein [Desulfomarina profundi]BCL62292.1 hypothetical protein DGMP_29850 [Desulfomarina profundi]
MQKRNWLMFLCLASVFFFFIYSTPHAKSNIPRITVHFKNVDLSTCVTTILRLAGSSAKIIIDKDIKKKITKSVQNKRWDQVLKDILDENNLQLIKQANSTYLIVKNRKKTIVLTEESLNLPDPEKDCPPDGLITLGYKYSTGTNPYGLIGKCVKIKNVTPIQYMDARKALVTWSYRGGSGTVLVEDRSEKGTALNNTRFMTGIIIGTYDYTSVLGAKMIIPHLVLR